MKNRDPDPVLYRFYYEKLKRTEELHDVLLKVVERIADGHEIAPKKAAELALEAYDAATERHAEDDRRAELEYLADQAADARREELMMGDSA